MNEQIPWPRKLNLGSGMKPLPGMVNLDKVSAVPADIYHDLDVIPYPLPSDHFDEIHCYDVLEHVDDLIPVMEELHRIARPSCRIFITTPHFSSDNSFTDPTHRHHFGFHSFDYFTGDTKWNWYTNQMFSYKKRRIVFSPWKKLVEWFANRQPDIWEEHLAWILPAWLMIIELEVVK